ncbi:60S ribosomal subunit assembly/export protein [Cladophialophora chaetospira]|uniref:60S ribosomal subunit assembly/export protein n=1 Tax=Cladophialophora chaetospira TaxID=386627 RepID=A0AA39CLS8_9EURO|nr:60S ribosomal subunit assembly/export protein [Cladophialophora chaetospira]
MAPSRTSTIKNPKARKPSTSGPPFKSNFKSKITKRAPAKQVKTKPGVHSGTVSQQGKPSARKKKVYSAKELDLPALNMITPVAAPENPTNLAKRGGTGKKKNKIYIDDEEGMRTILAMVTAEKEGQIESKLMRARQLEEVREARRAEMERRKEGRREELEGVKEGLKKGKKRRDKKDGEKGGDGVGKVKDGKSKKKVSFARTSEGDCLFCLRAL